MPGTSTFARHAMHTTCLKTRRLADDGAHPSKALSRQATAACALALCIFLHGAAVAPGDGASADASSVAVADEIQPQTLAASPARQAQFLLAHHLSHRYRIAADAAQTLVGITYDAGRQIGVDPLLILAVIAVESRFNPIAESEMGAQGLMQVIPKFHWDKLGGKERYVTALHPFTNIRLGTRVLKEYIDATGSLEAGLQKYNGALADDGNHYAQKVLAERARYAQIIHGQDAGIAATPDNRGTWRAPQQQGANPKQLTAALLAIGVSRSM
jgi:soluble lytic murein transglycosylase-like protein